MGPSFGRRGQVVLAWSKSVEHGAWRKNKSLRRVSGTAGGPLVDGPRAGRRCGWWMGDLECDLTKLDRSRRNLGLTRKSKEQASTETTRCPSFLDTWLFSEEGPRTPSDTLGVRMFIHLRAGPVQQLFLATAAIVFSRRQWSLSARSEAPKPSHVYCARRDTAKGLQNHCAR